MSQEIELADTLRRRGFYAFYLHKDSEAIHEENWVEMSQPSKDKRMLLTGLIFTMRTFSERLSAGEGASLKAFSTTVYKCHIFESPTGYRLILMTCPDAPTLSETLQQIHSQIVLPLVTSPSFELNSAVDHSEFSSALFQFLMHVPPPDVRA